MGKHKLSSSDMWTFIHSYVNWCSSTSSLDMCNTTSSRLKQNVQLKSIILITTVALIVCCNCYDVQASRFTEKREIHLAGIFPIYGDKGWQGGQVILTFSFVFNSIITRNNICASRMQYNILWQNATTNKFYAQ